jgi:S-adenosylmethionine:tRNA ribosyltransferase-isomerase
MLEQYCRRRAPQGARGMKLSDFYYELPAERIAQRPLATRDASRLLLLERERRAWQDEMFRALPELLRGDELLVVNNTRVLPARLLGRREGVRAERPGKHAGRGGEFLSSPIEVLLTREVGPMEWEALVRPGRKMQLGERVLFGDGELEAEVTGRGDYGLRTLRFTCRGDWTEVLERLGHMPLPPYIHRPDDPEDRERYQTAFARHPGAVAAPTASLHFTPALLEAVRARGVPIVEITLHVGLGTFQPIHAEDIEEHRMHRERYLISEEAAAAIHEAQRDARPILAAGTTVVRALEDAAQHGLPIAPGARDAELFVRPGHAFRVVNQLLTNFHLPQSSLLVLVAAFAGREFLLEAYRHAVAARYRFYSYGDCMFIR